MLSKVGSCLAAVMLAVAMCLGPYSQAAYAWVQLAVPAGQALAAVLAVLGVSVVIESDSDAAALWSDFELYTDDLEALAAGVSSLQDTAIANGNLVNATKAQVSAQEVDAIKDVFAAAGQAGTFALDQLSIWASDGVLGLLPFLLSSFIADRLSASAVDASSFQLVDGLGTINLVVTDGLIMPDSSIPYTYHSSIVFYLPRYGVYALTGNLASGSSIGLNVSDKGLIWIKQFGLGSTCYSPGDSRVHDYTGPLSQSYIYLSDVSNLYITPGTSLYILGRTGYFGNSGVRYVLWDGTSWNTDLGIVVDNPDVNLGRDWWDDAREKGNADLLNPSAGAAVIGSDAVIDGDYVRNRGSIAIPTDWSNINSWADALGATHAGVAEGVLDGTISTTQTGTAVDVGTGEFVTDTVGGLVRPGGGTSVSPALPGLFDGVLDAVGDKFPFCIPGDLHKCLLALGAAPVAPAFDWTFPLHHVGLTDVTIHIDLAPYDQVAMILRVCLSVTMTIGLIFLSIRLLNMWGGD